MTPDKTPSILTSLTELRTETDLDERLSRPSEADVDVMRRLPGDMLVLGAGGKMGPSLTRRLARASTAAGVERRIYAASRFTSSGALEEVTRSGATPVTCDLLAAGDVARLPHADHVFFLAGRKFGTSDRVDLTWAANVLVPAHVTARFQSSRLIVFSTGNVYPFVPIASRGAAETDAPAPVGEYAQSCLGRERIFEYASREHGTPALLFRLSYAIDLRYGVLVDIARTVWADESVDLTVGRVNAIWQGDANSYALRALELCESPARILNVTGPDAVPVRDAAAFFAERFDKPLRLRGTEATHALLNDASDCHARLGPPEVGTYELMAAVANWVRHGGRSLDKPTHYEVTDGRF